jgi:hypothetical protein
LDKDKIKVVFKVGNPIDELLKTALEKEVTMQLLTSALKLCFKHSVFEAAVAVTEKIAA